jgi:hypothetical protein
MNISDEYFKQTDQLYNGQKPKAYSWPLLRISSLPCVPLSDTYNSTLSARLIFARQSYEDKCNAGYFQKSKLQKLYISQNGDKLNINFAN